MEEKNLVFQVNSYYASNALPKTISVFNNETMCCNGDDFQRDEVGEDGFKKIPWEDQDFGIYLFGCTQTGESVCLRAKTYPSLMIQLPDHCDADSVKSITDYVKNTKRVKDGDMFYSFNKLHKAGGFFPDVHAKTAAFAKFPFLCFYFRTQSLLGSVRGMFQSRSSMVPEAVKPFLFEVSDSESYSVYVIEKFIPPILQFLHQSDCTPTSVIEVKGKHLKLNRTQKNKFSICNIEGELKFFPFHGINSIIPSSTLDIYPLKILSFDIECLNPLDNGFPDPNNPAHKIIAIVGCVWNTGTDKIESFVHGLDNYDDFPAEPDHSIKCFRYSEEMLLLEGFRDTIVMNIDPDVYTGYNIDSFDWNYIHIRAMLLNPQSRFFCFSKLIRVPCEFLASEGFTSKAYGSSDSSNYDIPGAINFDLYTYIKRNEKLDDYKLGTVAKAFLKDDKDDLSIPMMKEYWLSGDSYKRYLVMKYCRKDSLLPIYIIRKKVIIPTVVGMSRVTKVFLNDLFKKGQMFKVQSMLYIFARKQNFALTYLPAELNAGQDGYQGATVLEVLPGLYENVIVLDFASLYPSIMCAWNMCFSSFVTQAKYNALPQFKYEHVEIGQGQTASFQVSLKGLIPQMAEELLQSRKLAKKQMAEAYKVGNTDLGKVLNGRQLALKISCNSIYGFIGAITSKYCCLPIASAVTSKGRNLIHQTQSFVEKNFTDWQVKVVAGDTDSVMIYCGDKPTFTVAFERGAEMARQTTRLFPKAIVMEFEKVYKAAIFMQKKHYVGYCFEGINSPGKLDAKGVALVRRDFALYNRELYERVVHDIIIKANIPKSVQTLQDGFQELLDNKVSVNKLGLTRQLGREYANDNQMTKVVAEKMEARDPGNGPKPGERIGILPIVLSQGHTKAALYEKVDAFDYVVSMNIPINKQYYIEALKPSMDKLYLHLDANVRDRIRDVFSYFISQANRQMNGYADLSKYSTAPRLGLDVLDTASSVVPKTIGSNKRKKTVKGEGYGDLRSYCTTPLVSEIPKPSGQKRAAKVETSAVRTAWWVKK